LLKQEEDKMNKRFKSFLIMLLLIFILAVAIIFLVRKKETKNVSFLPVNTINLKSFEPFGKENTLSKYNTEFKIDGTIPKIEAASASYILGSCLIESICNENDYMQNLKLVSTNDAYNDIIQNSTDMIIATKPSDDQKALIENSGKKLKFVKIGEEKLVFYVNKNNTVKSLSIDDIKNMYENKIAWNEFGYISNYINTYQLKKNNGSQTCFESISKYNKLDENHKEVDYMEEMIDKVGSDPYGIGYAFNSFYSKMYVNENIKKINIDGIDIKSTNYPLKYDIYLVYDEEKTENENVLRIEEWLKTEDGLNFIKFYEEMF